MSTALTDHRRSLCENKYLGSWNLWKDGKYTTVTVTIERVTQCDRCNGTGELVTARDYQGHELAVRACEECGGLGTCEAAKEDDDDAIA